MSGKGGVGKSTLSVLLGLAAAERGKTALIVETNSSGRIAPIFGVDQAPHKVVRLTRNLGAINLLPENSFKEYALSVVSFKAIYNAVFTNKYVSNFLNAAPGLDEFMMLAKIDKLVQEKQKLSSKPTFDIVIVDAPATGHALSLLEVPAIIASAIRLGPPHKHARSILSLLADTEQTALCAVTLAEEMPVCESEEFVRDLGEKTKVSLGPLFVNAVMPAPAEASASQRANGDLSFLNDYYRLARSRAALNQHYLEEINKRFPGLDKIVLPFQFNPLRSHEAFAPLVAHLKDQ